MEGQLLIVRVDMLTTIHPPKRACAKILLTKYALEYHSITEQGTSPHILRKAD